jgi:preflagellin peptidase FlaK
LQALFIGGKVTLSLIILLYASWKDYKTREVTNKVWVVYAPIALLLSLVELILFDSARLSLYGISFGITCVFALLLFYSGGFGGADSKALMCIALALPFSTEKLFSPIFASGVSPLSQILFPLTIFSNSVLFAAASGIYMLLRNFVRRIETGKKLFEGTLATESITKKLIVLITGYKVPIYRLKKKWHIYPMEDISDYDDNQLNRKLVVVPRDEGRDEVVNRLYKAAIMGKISDYVWATPGLPMLIFVTIGLIVSILFGDFIWIIISYILG